MLAAEVQHCYTINCSELGHYVSLFHQVSFLTLANIPFDLPHYPPQSGLLPY